MQTRFEHGAIKYAGLETSDLVRLKQLEAENAQLRRIVARKELELEVVAALDLSRRNRCDLDAFACAGFPKTRPGNPLLITLADRKPCVRPGGTSVG